MTIKTSNQDCIQRGSEQFIFWWFLVLFPTLAASRSVSNQSYPAFLCLNHGNVKTEQIDEKWWDWFSFLITQIISASGEVEASQNMAEFFENWKSALEKVSYVQI